MFDKAKEIIKADACMKFLDVTKLLYIETYMSGVGLGAALLQTRSNTSCLRDKVLDNGILRPIAFSKKSLTGAEKIFSNIERESLGILHGLKNPLLLLCERGKYNYRSQTTSFNIQKGYSYIITEASANSVKNTSIQCQNHIQAWTRPIHSRLAVQTKPQ